jgi:hypothetical protein
MRNRRILDEIFAAAGAEAKPIVETDTMGALIAHVASRRLTTVVSQAWLYAFGVPDGMCVRPLAPQGPGQQIGLVLLGTEPAPYLAEACVTAVKGLDVETRLTQAIAPFLTVSDSST